MNNIVHSALYRGYVQHRRFTPKKNSFRYPVCMAYIDLDEASSVFSLSRLWKKEQKAPVSFYRKDFFDGSLTDLKTSILDFAEKESGQRPSGAVRLLANLRYFGYITNPIACYYCFDKSRGEEQLKGVVAEVTNTPWHDRCWYYIPANGAEKVQHQFKKSMHVSPFMPMDLDYHWQNSIPGENLALAIQTYQNGKMNFTASLLLSREEMSAKNQRSFVFKYPLETVKVISRIYWQALKIWVKGIPYIPKPPTANPPSINPQQDS